MTTVDNLLLKITSELTPDIESKIPAKDIRVLKSLSRAVIDPIFITENQSRLLLKILHQYKEIFSTIENNISEFLLSPTWSKSFRPIDKTKKVFISKGVEQNNEIFVEFAHNLQIRKTLQGMSKDFEGGLQALSSRLFKIELTEKNIALVVENLKPFNFDFDEKIRNFYEIMKKWDFGKECENLIFGEKLNLKLKEKLIEEIGIENLEDKNFITDRSLRFHYFTKKPENVEETLENLITHRTQTKLWINSNQHNLENVINVLAKLKRLPVLVVFDGWNNKSCYDNLKKMENSLESNGITEHIGVYFRLDNQDSGELFNKLIAEKKYNAKLDENTLFACVQGGKLPKFFLKDCNWVPKSVIVLGTNLRHSKTAVYSNRCDLIISYSDKKSIFDANDSGNKDTWVL